MANQESVDGLRLGYSIMAGKKEGEYLVVDTTEKELQANCMGFQIDILNKVREQIKQDIISSPNLVNDVVEYKILIFISASSVVLFSPFAVLKSGLNNYMFHLEGAKTLKRVKTVKTLAKKLSQYFTDETTMWSCSACNTESFAYEPIFVLSNNVACLKCIYEKKMGGEVRSIKYSNGGEMLNLLKIPFAVKSISNRQELDKEVGRMIGLVDNKILA